MVSTEKLLALREWYGNPNLACLPIAGAAAAAVVAALDELLAYREGYDPAERLPEAGVKVLVQSERTGTLESASIQIWAETGEQKWQGRGWWAPIGYARRWYPMPGGER